MSYDQCKRLVQYARKRDIMRWAAEGLNHELNGMRPEDQEALITDLRAQRKFMEAMRWKKRHGIVDESTMLREIRDGNVALRPDASGVCVPTIINQGDTK